MNTGQVLAVLRYEARRTMAAGRILVWVVMAGFPPAIITLIGLVTRQYPPMFRWVLVVYGLTQVVAALGMLLWATPAIQVELESRTWPYTATRPYGRRAVLLGRYAMAVLWGASSAMVAGVACILIAATLAPGPTPDQIQQYEMARQRIRYQQSGQPLGDAPVDSAPPPPLEISPYVHPVQDVVSIVVLAGLACPAIGALYCLIGVLFPRKGMVIAFIVTFVLEVLVTYVPAVVNQLTIQFRLRSLLVRWSDVAILKSGPTPLFSQAPTYIQLLALALYVTLLLGAAIYILERRELTAGDDA